MGMYSFYSYEDIEVKDWDNLKEFFDIFKEEYPEEVENNPFLSKDKMIKKGDDGKEYLTFKEWNEIKLISYWYDGILIFLKGIAKYVEGQVEWDFESKDEAGYINFEDGECKITTGVMDWTENSPDKIGGKIKFKPKMERLYLFESLK